MAKRDEEIAGALRDMLQSPNEVDSNFEVANIVDALFFVGRRIGQGLRNLGGGENSDPRGAVEFLAVSVKDAGTLISDAISDLAGAIRESRP